MHKRGALKYIVYFEFISYYYRHLVYSPFFLPLLLSYTYFKARASLRLGSTCTVYLTKAAVPDRLPTPSRARWCHILNRILIYILPGV